TDRFYTLFDHGVAKGTAPSTVIGDSVLLPLASDFVVTATTPGCYLPLGLGGKGVRSASTTGGNTYFSTNRPTPPSSTSCNINLGVAKGYRIPLFCGRPDSIEFAGVGRPPSP